MYAGYVIKSIAHEKHTKFRIVSPRLSTACDELGEYELVSMQDVVAYIEYEHRKLWDEVKNIELRDAARKFVNGVTQESQKNQS